MTIPEPLTVEPAADTACAVCPHPLQGHDPLGVRYCNATAASALPRGCICS